MRDAHVLLMILLAGMVSPTSARGDERLFSREAFRSELDLMYRQLQADAYDLYAFTPKQELDRLHDQLLAETDAADSSSPNLTRFQVEARLQLFAAAAHLGHARVEGAYGEWAAFQKGGGRAFPLSLRIDQGRVYVARNLSGMARIHPGDEIIALDGEPVGLWLERTRRHVSAETTYMADSILDYDFPMYLWVEIGERPTFKVSIRPKDGAAFVAEIPARTAAEMSVEQAHQRPALDLEHPLRDARILANGVGYLRPGPFYNEAAKTGADEWDVSGFKRFVDDAFHMFKAKGVTRLIIDLRGNPGGDSLFSDVMVSRFADRPYKFFSSFKVRVSEDAVAANRSRIEHDAVAAGPISQRFAALYASAKTGDTVEFTLPPSEPSPSERFGGQVFVLVDRQTYSNAVAVAATIQDYRFGLILGEPTADIATTYGAMEQFTLPVTGLVVGFPKARIVRPNGDPRSQGVTPDLTIPTPIVQTPDDEVLRRASEIAAGSRR